jgi:hypothetical protein
MSEDIEVMSALERIKRKNEAEERQRDEFKKIEVEYKRCLNAVASTEDGAFVLRAILNRCWVFIPDGNATPAQRYERSLLRDLYLGTIRKYLDKDLIHKLEV